LITVFSDAYSILIRPKFKIAIQCRTSVYDRFLVFLRTTCRTVLVIRNLAFVDSVVWNSFPANLCFAFVSLQWTYLRIYYFAL